MFDYLVVGAGFSGCVLAERIASQLDKLVLIVDIRDHIGGNAYDYYNEHGILVHKYGPHWFHTNDKHVFEYLSQFTEWRCHFHRVRACVDGLLLPIPINMDTINQLYGMNLHSPQEVQEFLDSVKEDIPYPHNAEEMILSRVGRDLYHKFFLGYTLKQWATDPKKLDKSVAARIPIRTNRDNRYFSDTYQVMPRHGYTAMFKHMLAHKNISVLLKTDYRSIINVIPFNKLIFTGPIDSFFDWVHGKLPYRSVRSEHETHDMEYYQPTQQINFPNEYNFTRIIEWKHATGQKHLKTTITREYPQSAMDERDKYYPIPTVANDRLGRKYQQEASKLKTVIFLGRLAEYKYYNMDQVVAKALHTFQTRVTTW
jgi:UDP-galactopyranose mutase